MKILFLILLYGMSSYSGNSVENGGDSLATEFVQIARTAIYYLKSTPLNIEDQKIVNRLEKNINITTVNTAEKLFLRGEEVEAINYPLEMKIVVNRNRWIHTKLQSPGIQTTFVMHEYLGVSGIDDSHYFQSKRLVDLILSKLHENMISAEQVQGILGGFLSSVFMAALEVDQMIAAKKVSWEIFCTHAGAFSSQESLLSAIIRNHLFWFDDKEDVENKINILHQHAGYYTQSCFKKKIVLTEAKKNILEDNQILKFLMMKLQFPD